MSALNWYIILYYIILYYIIIGILYLETVITDKLSPCSLGQKEKLLNIDCKNKQQLKISKTSLYCIECNPILQLCALDVRQNVSLTNQLFKETGARKEKL